MNLSRFERPSRYINNEFNAIRRDSTLSVALAFPDIYDIGMSHLGLKILYKIINDLPYASAERVFHPWIDLEGHMKQEGLRLCSLESGRPLGDFDVVGFSLQYELSFTSVINMLSLGGIPLMSEERTAKHPLIIAGGPCTVNPMPMSPFMDAFLIGDGEDAIKEILETVSMWKTGGDGRKESLLRGLVRVEGLYVPSVSSGAKRRFISSLDDAPYPLAPVVPYAQIVHDRVNVEVSRGCSMGCRYCQAGMIYRPVRERSPERALEIAEVSLKATGYEEVSFTSLSAGDYGPLIPLLREFNRRFREERVSVSLPSLRVKAVSEGILREIKSVRKTGFTIAPEAATERLRTVINKDFREEDYEQAVQSLFKEGWHTLKLYYMIGLPTETEEDIEAIPKMAMKALKIAKTYTKRFVNINVSVSPFVPKPHTPFQWCAQAATGEMKRKKDYLRGAMRGINIKGHDERMSMLEAAFARGDEKLSALLLAAHEAGSRLDAWTECFDFELWQRAMEKTGVDAAAYAMREYGTDEALPWDKIDIGIEKRFLKEEFESARKAVITEDCRKACAGCGLGCPEAKPVGEQDAAVLRRRPATGAQPVPPGAPLERPLKLRAEFSKTGALCYLSHREVMNLFARALRRAGIRLHYSKGFHPAPRLAFGPPLNVGVSGLREYFDMEVMAAYDLEALAEAINSKLKEGVGIARIVPVRPGEPSLQSFISRYEYEIICPDEKELLYFRQRKERMGQAPSGLWELVEQAEEADGGARVNIILGDTGMKKVRLDEVLRELFGVPASGLEVRRVAMYGFKEQWLMPIGIESGLNLNMAAAG
ncbi:MAG: TIGR03936 family radical SAM-associated protein [Thermodesulfovibrionales bacterium]|nr:TIGR03936 family radical SAM-associated protein [Thermodesulfovibrionales bacterium]